MYKTILHAADLNEAHFHISEKAKAFADLCKARLYLLHVIELPASIQLAQGLGFAELQKPSKEEAIAVLQTLGEALNVPESQQFVAIGTVSDEIIKKVQSLNCDLIIVGSHRENAFQQFLGSSANATVHKAPCDVLTIRNL